VALGFTYNYQLNDINKHNELRVRLMRHFCVLLKRAFDITISLLVLIFFIPLWIIISILIVCDSEGPFLFLQQRLGKSGKPFVIYKFRTMIKDADKTGFEVKKGDERITRIGKILRATSLDEIPQFLNVIKGEMSVVGPRPALVRDFERYDEEQKRRLEMRPGITGLAQVCGRATLSWPERIKYDLEYINNWSIWLDIRIILKTIKKIVSKEDLYNQVGSGWK
jgi:undecaprenyl phosphate N,N'-diacetylbacillosamine 1-phosphate transferase